MLSHLLTLPISMLITGLIFLSIGIYHVSKIWKRNIQNEKKIYKWQQTTQHLAHEEILIKKSLRHYQQVSHYLQDVNQQLVVLQQHIDTRLQANANNCTQADNDVNDAFNTYSIFHHEKYSSLQTNNSSGEEGESGRVVGFEITLPKEIKEAREKLEKENAAWYAYHRKHTPHAEHSHTPHAEHSHTPHAEHSHTPHTEHSHTPHTEHTHAPHAEHTHAPHAEHTHAPHTEHTHAPHAEHTHAPHAEHTHAPHTKHSHTPHAKHMPENIPTHQKDKEDMPNKDSVKRAHIANITNPKKIIVPSSKRHHKAQTIQIQNKKTVRPQLIKIVKHVLIFGVLSTGALLTISALKGITFLLMSPIPNTLAILGLSSTITSMQYRREKKIKQQYQEKYTNCLAKHNKVQNLKQDEDDIKNVIQYEFQNNTNLKATIKQQLTHPALKQHQVIMDQHPLMQPFEMPELTLKR